MIGGLPRRRHRRNTPERRSTFSISPIGARWPGTRSRRRARRRWRRTRRPSGARRRPPRGPARGGARRSSEERGRSSRELVAADGGGDGDGVRARQLLVARRRWYAHASYQRVYRSASLNPCPPQHSSSARGGARASGKSRRRRGTCTRTPAASAARLAAELVQGRQPELLHLLDDNGVHGGDVQPRFDDEAADSSTSEACAPANSSFIAESSCSPFIWPCAYIKATGRGSSGA